MARHKTKEPCFLGLSYPIQVQFQQKFSFKTLCSWHFQPQPGVVRGALVQRRLGNLARGNAAVWLDRRKPGRDAAQASEELLPEHGELLGPGDRHRRMGRPDQVVPELRPAGATVTGSSGAPGENK